MAKQIKNHNLSLNLLNPWHKRIHDHVVAEGGSNISGYLKSLVERDMAGWNASPQLQNEPHVPSADFAAADFI
jgi:hypothetical protein